MSYSRCRLANRMCDGCMTCYKEPEYEEEYEEEEEEEEDADED